MKTILIASVLSVLAGSAFAAATGYDEFVSACSTKAKTPVCTCIARNLKAKDVTEDQARYLAGGYRDKHLEKTDDESVELEWFEDQLAESCLKNSKFEVTK